MKKQITLKNEHHKECPECDGDLVFQDEWEDLFDRYDRKMPSFDLIVNQLHKEGVPKYICNSCKLQVLIKQ